MPYHIPIPWISVNPPKSPVTGNADFGVLEGMAENGKTDLSVEVGRRLRAARRALGVSQNSLAKAIGAGDPPQGGKRLSNWEKGEKMLPPEFATAIAQRHGLTTDFFYRNITGGIEVRLLEAIEKALAEVMLGKAKRGRPFGKGASSSSSRQDVEEKTIAPAKRQRRKR
jgi:transcriptional regulator with XRE-family HTH domain